MIGGTTFIKDNKIKQDFVHNQISLLGNKCTVPTTQCEAPLPIVQHISTSLNTLHTNTNTNTIAHQPHKNIIKPLGKSTILLVSIKAKRIILPGDDLKIKIDLPD